MPKTQVKKKRAPKSYTQYFSSSENDSPSEDDLGIVSGFLEFLMQRKRKKTPKRSSNKRCSTNCTNCSNKRTPKQRSKSTKTSGNSRCKKKNEETSVGLNSHMKLDSDDEIASTSTTNAYTNDIKDKVDSFFKALESDDEELENNIQSDSAAVNAPIEKNEDFYTILSESENEEDKKVKEKISSIINAPAGSGGLVDTITTGLKVVNDFKVNPEKRTEDLLAYVDEILKETVDLTDNRTKENVPGLTLEDMKKKTDEILGDVASMIDDLKPKPKEPENKNDLESSVKEAPSCPICFEQLGGSRQAMATLCGHMFCEPCLNKIIKTTKKCPSCRKGLTKTKYHPVYI